MIRGLMSLAFLLLFEVPCEMAKDAMRNTTIGRGPASHNGAWRYWQSGSNEVARAISLSL